MNGLAAIKENLGCALVQAPSSAAYDAMPSSAIAAGLADFVGTPKELAQRLDAFVAHTAARVEPGEAASRTEISAVLAAAGAGLFAWVAAAPAAFAGARPIPVGENATRPAPPCARRTP